MAVPLRTRLILRVTTRGPRARPRPRARDRATASSSKPMDSRSSTSSLRHSSTWRCPRPRSGRVVVSVPLKESGTCSAETVTGARAAGPRGASVIRLMAAVPLMERVKS
jgi:hypothetical protein